MKQLIWVNNLKIKWQTFQIWPITKHIFNKLGIKSQDQAAKSDKNKLGQEIFLN